LKGYKLWDSDNKKTVLSRNVTFDEALMVKSIVSQQVKSMKTKEASQRVEDVATPCSQIGSVLVGISPNVILSGDRVAVLDTKQVKEKNDLFIARGTKKNPQK